jgi:hypothetical protein
MNEVQAVMRRLCNLRGAASQQLSGVQRLWPERVREGST